MMDMENGLEEELESIKNEASWIREENRSKFITIYWIYIFTRLIISLILQCIYLILKKQSVVQENSQAREVELGNNLKLVQNLMIFFGQIHRADGTTGVLFYSLSISVILTFNLIKIVSGGKIFNVLSGNRMMLFLAKPELEGRIVRRKIGIILDKMIYSNKNFTDRFVKYVIKIEGDEKENRHPLYGASGTNQNPVRNSFRDIEMLGSQQENSHSEIFNDLAAQLEITEGLLKQRQHLIKLKEYPANIWPPTRNTAWFYKLRNLGALLYIHFSIYVWIFGQIWLSISFYLGYQTVKDSNEFGQENRQYSLKERLLCAEYHFLTYMLMFSFMPTFLTYTINLFYQVAHLKELWPRMNSIYGRVTQCESWLYHSNQNLNNDFKFFKQIKSDLKFECDKKAIELYINYQIFRDEIRLAVRVGSTASNQIVSFLIISLLPNLAFFKYAPESHIPTLLLVGLSIVMSANIPFLICASSNTSCNRFAKGAWSLLAFANGHNFYLYQLAMDRTNMGIYRKNHDQYKLSLQYLENQPMKQAPDYGYISESFISPHTMLLWRRLVENHQTVTNDFVCKLFGVFKINYSGILKFNHWLVWVALISALQTYQKSSSDLF